MKGIQDFVKILSRICLNGEGRTIIQILRSARGKLIVQKNTLESKKNNKSRHNLQKCLDLVLHIYYQKKTVALQISWAETYACTHIMHIGILYVSFFQFFGARKCNSTSQVATLQLYKVTTDRYLLLLDPNKTVCTPAEFSYIKTRPILL